MSLATASDYAFLSSWNFRNEYPQHRDPLVQLGKDVFQLLKSIAGVAPQESDCEVLLTWALLGGKDFAAIVANWVNLPNPRDPYWRYFFVGAIARWMLDQEWPDISI